jgi:hypothetical protein
VGQGRAAVVGQVRAGNTSSMGGFLGLRPSLAGLTVLSALVS